MCNLVMQSKDLNKRLREEPIAARLNKIIPLTILKKLIGRKGVEWHQLLPSESLMRHKHQV